MRSNSSSLLLIPVLGWQMETLYSQAHSLSAHEAIACVCESKEWWKSGEYDPDIFFYHMEFSSTTHKQAF